MELPNEKYAPGQALPVGSVTIRQHRYDSPRAWVKVAEPSTWVLRAVKVWELAGGPPIPKGFVLHHVDGDSLNDDIKNLVLISQAAHSQFHKEILRKRQTGMEYKMKPVICSKCSTTFEGKYQFKNSTCPQCRRVSKRALRAQRYQATGE